MRLAGRTVSLRAVEPRDVDLLYVWENDVDLWAVSGTTEPFSREQMVRFVERQLGGADLLHTGQLRLMIEVPKLEDQVQVQEQKQEQEPKLEDQKQGQKQTPKQMSQEFGPAEIPCQAAEAVGAVDLFEYDPIHRRAGIGIVIYGAKHRRRGYALETLEILCRYAREQLYLHQLWCTVGADNTPSRELFRRAGFVESGVKRDWLRTPEGFRDEVILQKILE